MRSLIGIGCKIELTQQRTMEIWSNFLVSMDGSEVLPEPQFQ